MSNPLPARRVAMLAAAALVLIIAGCGSPELDRHTTGDPRAGLSAFKFAGCAGCHTISGIAVGESGPSLDGEGNRRGAPWLRAMLPAHARATNLAPLNPRDQEDLVAYLESLR